MELSRFTRIVEDFIPRSRFPLISCVLKLSVLLITAIISTDSARTTPVLSRTRFAETEAFDVARWCAFCASASSSSISSAFSLDVREYLSTLLSYCCSDFWYAL